jgi:hypothetical protein
MLLIGVWLNWLLQYVRNSSALAPNDISVVVVASAIWDDNRLVILLTLAESVAAVTTSKIPTKLNGNIFTLSSYVMLLLSIIIVMIIIIMYYYQINQLGSSSGGTIITCIL